MLTSQKAFRLLNVAVRSQVVPRARMSGSPGGKRIPIGELLFGSVLIASAAYVPIFWVMSHLDDYRK